MGKHSAEQDERPMCAIRPEDPVDHHLIGAVQQPIAMELSLILIRVFVLESLPKRSICRVLRHSSSLKFGFRRTASEWSLVTLIIALYSFKIL